MNVLLDAKRRPSQLYTALLGAAAAVGDWPTVERAYKDAEQQLAAGCMPQRAFRFVERAYRRLMGGRAAAGEGEGGGEEKEAVVRREEEAAVAVVAIK